MEVVEEKLKAKRQRKPKTVKQLEPVLEPVPEPEPSPEPQPEPESEPVVPCEVCGQPAAFSEEELKIYRRINAHKRKQLRLKKAAVITFVEV